MTNIETTKLTPFGVYVRKLRLDNDERLKDMAEHMDVTPTYLSSVEHGRRVVPTSWVDKIRDLYHLHIDDVDELQEVVNTSRLLHLNKLDVSHLSEDEKYVIGKLAEKIPHYTDIIRKDLRSLVDD